MRTKFPLLALSLVMAAGMCVAAPPTTDSQAVDTIQSRLDHAKINQHGNVQVAFDKGVATLTGTVDSLQSKLDAEKAAKKAHGVTSVVDNLQVRTAGVSDQEIMQQAYHKLLTYYAYGVFDYVTPQIHHGTLVVTGYVTQPFKKDDLGRTFAEVKGVAAIQNNLEVLPVSQFDDRLRLQLSRAIYGNPYFTPYTHMAIPPIRIIVKNQNVVLVGVVDNEADKIKAGMVANSTGLSFSVVNNLQVVREPAKS